MVECQSVFSVLCICNKSRTPSRYWLCPREPANLAKHPTNTCAVRYETYQFEGQLTAGSGIEWLIPNFIASNQGGVGLSSGGWIDAVTVTGSVRTLASLSPGEIDVEVFVNGASEGLVAKLTTQAPTFARRIRTALTNSDFTAAGQNIMVRCNKNSMAIAEYVTVVVHVGYFA